VKTEFETELQEHEAAQSGEASASFRRQLADVVQRNSRLIACALLQIAAEEYGARETIRRRGGYPNLESAPFRFSKSQIILGVLLVFVTCATVGPIVQLAQQAGDATPAQVWDSLQRWSFWGFVGAFSYLLPLVLAASVQLWLLDSDEEEGADRDWMFKITVLLIALVGCFMMAALPLFLGAIVKAKIFKETYAPLIVLFALVPACTAVLFIPISRRRIDRSHSFNAAVDFATFGAAAAFVSYLTASLIKLADFASQNIAMGPLFEAMSRDLPAISLVAFFVGGGFGALHCAASRQLVEAARAARARTAEMGFLSAAMNALR
jgi:hypothetical protein